MLARANSIPWLKFVLYKQEMNARVQVESEAASSGETPKPVSLSVQLIDRQMQDIARALSEPRRFQILQQIAAQTCSACSDLRASQPVTAATLSHHLKELEHAGLISATKRGKFMDLHFRRDVWNAYLAQLNQL